MQQRKLSKDNDMQALVAYPHLSQYIEQCKVTVPVSSSPLLPGASTNEDDAVSQLDEGEVVSTNPLLWRHLVNNPADCEHLNQLLSDKKVFSIAVNTMRPDILTELLAVKKGDLAYRMKFFHEVVDLKLWQLDLVKSADYLEAIITNDNPSKKELDENEDGYTRYFDDDVARNVASSKVADGTFEIKVNDPDVIKYIKSFINITRSVNRLDSNIKHSYISHLLSTSDGWHATDSNLRSIIRLAINNSDQFDHLYHHFMAFKFYSVEVGDLLSNLPLLQGKAKEVFDSLKVIYAKTNLKQGVDYLTGSNEKRDNKRQAMLDETVIPMVDGSKYEQLLDNFGIRTYLDAFTGIARVMNAAHDKRYYIALSDSYSYPPSVSAESRMLMDTYNACSGARMQLKIASEKFDSLKVDRKKLGANACWSALNEDQRKVYIDFSNAMLKAAKHITAMQPLVKKYPKLRHIMKFGDKHIKLQIRILSSWKDSSPERNITTLENAVTANKILIWITKQVKKLITAEDRLAYYDDELDLYTPANDLSEDKRNTMLGYNIVARVKRANEQVEKISNEKFKLSHIGVGIHLLYEIGEIVKDYRRLGGGSFVTKFRDQLSHDLSALLEFIVSIYQTNVYRCAKLEEKQGLRKGVLAQYLDKFHAAYDYCMQKNNGLPDLYKLNIQQDGMDLESIDIMKGAASEEIEMDQQVLAANAYKARELLETFEADILSPSPNLVRLLQVKESIDALPGHNANQYAELLQLVIKKLVGLDTLENEIRDVEDRVKNITGDNADNAGDFEHDTRIQSDLAVLRELYAYRANQEDMLANINSHKYEIDDVEDIEVSYFYKKGSTKRVINGLSSLFYNSENNKTIYTTYPGVDENIDLSGIAKDMSKLHNIVLQETLDLRRDEVVNNIRFSPKRSDKSKESLADDECLAQAKRLINDTPKMIEHIIQSRKGDVVVQMEEWRRLFVEHAKKAVQPNHRTYLSKGTDKMGFYQIGDSDPVLVVNIKAISNTIVRIQQLMSTVLKLSEIPTDLKFSNVLAVNQIRLVLTELKERLNILFEDMEIMTESLTALYDCLHNNTLDAFQGDLAGHVIKIINMAKEVINYSYVSVDSDFNEMFQSQADKAMLHMSQFTNQDQNIDVVMQPIQPPSSLNATITNNLVLFLEYSGPVKKILVGEDIIYDVEGLSHGSVKKRVATLLNNHIINGVKIPDAADIVISDADDYKAIVLKVMKTMGESVQHLSTVESLMQPSVEIEGVILPVEEVVDENVRLLADDEDEMIFQNIDQEGRLTKFLRQFIQSTGASRANDGSYDLHDRRYFKDGSLNKLIATYLNIEANLNQFLDATVSMADGRSIVGLINSVWELVKIKRKIDNSEMLQSFSDTLHQFNFDYDIVKAAIDNLTKRALVYIEPKIVDAVVKARVAEVSTGIKEYGIVSKLKVAVKLFVKVSNTFVGKEFDYLAEDFPYNHKTVGIAQDELKRLTALQEKAEEDVANGIGSKHIFIDRAVNDLIVFVRSLTKAELNDAPKEKEEMEVQALPIVDAVLVNSAEPVNEDNMNVMIEVHSDSEDLNSDERQPLLSSVDEVQPVALQDGNDALQKNVKILEEACMQYKLHLVNDIIDLRKQAEPDIKCDNYDLYQAMHTIDNASEQLKLAVKKYNAVHAMHATLLKEDVSSEAKLQNFRAEYTPQRVAILNTRRDTAAVTFFKVVATVFTLCLALAFGLWKPKGEKLSEKIQQLAPLPQAARAG